MRLSITTFTEIQFEDDDEGFSLIMQVELVSNTLHTSTKEWVRVLWT